MHNNYNLHNIISCQWIILSCMLLIKLTITCKQYTHKMQSNKLLDNMLFWPYWWWPWKWKHNSTGCAEIFNIKVSHKIWIQCKMSSPTKGGVGGAKLKWKLFSSNRNMESSEAWLYFAQLLFVLRISLPLKISVVANSISFLILFFSLRFKTHSRCCGQIVFQRP